MGDAVTAYLVARLSALLGVPAAVLTAKASVMVGPFLAGVIVFYAGRQSAKVENNQKMAGEVSPLFLSLFGSYRVTGVNRNIRQPNGQVVGYSLHSKSEIEKLVRVKPVIKWLLYRAELVNPAESAAVFIRRSRAEKVTQVIKLGDLG